MTRQRFHLEPPKGLMNDPNGLVYFKGEYHVFFQWNRFENNHSYKEWGHYISKDFITWDFQGSALLPDQIYDYHGVYSGSAIVIDDTLHLYYTGNSKQQGERKSSQCLAISKDGKRFLKKGPMLETPKAFTEHFRDPKVFKTSDNQYWMVVGAQMINGKGAIAICSSKDGLHWLYRGKLLELLEYEMIECPDLFALDTKHVLLFCPQSRNNEVDTCNSSFAAYQLGDFIAESASFVPATRSYQRLDYGFDFYAPQTFLDANKQRIMLAWMSNMDASKEEIIAKNEPSIHCLTMPRVLSIQAGKLYQKPIAQMYQLLGKEIPVTITNETVIKKARYLKITDIDGDIEIQGFNDSCIFYYNAANQRVTLKRKCWVTSQFEEKCVSLEKLYTVEIWMDTSSIEIFINDGELTMTARIYPQSEDIKTVIYSKDTLEITAYEVNKYKRKQGGNEDDR